MTIMVVAVVVGVVVVGVRGGSGVGGDVDVGVIGGGCCRSRWNGNDVKNMSQVKADI